MGRTAFVSCEACVHGDTWLGLSAQQSSSAAFLTCHARCVRPCIAPRHCPMGGDWDLAFPLLRIPLLETAVRVLREVF